MPPGLAAAANPPPTPENPLPRAPNPEVPVADPKLDVAEVAGLKTDELVDAPSAPNGDFSEPAKAAMLEAANAEVEAFSYFPAAGFPSEANGEDAEVFANALAAKA